MAGRKRVPRTGELSANMRTALYLCSFGLSGKDAAKVMGITPSRIYHKLSSAYARLDTTNMQEAIALALARGELNADNFKAWASLRQTYRRGDLPDKQLLLIVQHMSGERVAA